MTIHITTLLCFVGIFASVAASARLPDESRSKGKESAEFIVTENNCWIPLKDKESLLPVILKNCGAPKKVSNGGDMKIEIAGPCNPQWDNPNCSPDGSVLVPKCYDTPKGKKCYYESQAPRSREPVQFSELENSETAR